MVGVEFTAQPGNKCHHRNLIVTLQLSMSLTWLVSLISMAFVTPNCMTQASLYQLLEISGFAEEILGVTDLGESGSKTSAWDTLELRTAEYFK